MTDPADHEPLGAGRDGAAGRSPLSARGPRLDDYPERERRRDVDLEAESASRQGRRSSRAPRRGGVLSGLDPATRRLAVGAAGLGGFLVLLVGGWSLMGHRSGGIPVIAPPPGPVRVKPVDPGGMQVLGAQMPSSDGTVQGLAPGPETPRPEALQAEVDAARHEAAREAPAAPAGAAPAVRAPDVGADRQAAAPQATAPVPRPSPPPPQQQQVPAVAPHEAASPASGQAVQLAAVDSEQAALGLWRHLVQSQPEALRGHQPLVERASRSGHVFYRLRTTGFASTAEATAFCGRLHQAGVACTLASF